MDYIVALPSYKRPDVLKQKTMALLERHNICKEYIHIFVADTEQEVIYRSAFPDYKIIVGCPGLMNVRNFITKLYAQDMSIFFMDDDVVELYRLDDKNLIVLDDLDNLIRSGFEYCRVNNRKLWGIYPVKNGFWMSHKITTDYKFCIGHMFGVLNQPNRLLELSDFKEDYERTLMYCKADGGVIRFNNVCAKTKLGASGGINTSVADRLEKNRQICNALVLKYPDCVRLNTRRDGEILIKNPKLTKRQGL
jgi:hypothetical protein